MSRARDLGNFRVLGMATMFVRRPNGGELGRREYFMYNSSMARMAWGQERQE